MAAVSQKKPELKSARGVALRDWWNPATAVGDYTNRNAAAKPGHTAARRLSDITSALQVVPRSTTSEAPGFGSWLPSEDLFEDASDLLFPDLRPISSARHTHVKPPRSVAQPKMRSLDSRQAGGVNTESKSQVLHEVEERPIFKKQFLSQREAHIHSERQRRKGMSTLFTTLQTMLPLARHKTDRCSVLTEVIEYIRSLRENLDDLGRKKANLLASLTDSEATDEQSYSDVTSVGSMQSGQTNDRVWENQGVVSVKYGGTAPRRSTEADTDEMLPVPMDVTVRLIGADVLITLNCPRKKGLWPKLLMILQKQNLDVENITLSTSEDIYFHCIHAKVVNMSKVAASEDLQEGLRRLIIAQLGGHYRNA